MTEQATVSKIEIPTVALDMNEASILAVVAKSWLIDNEAYMNETHLENWNALINKLAGN